MHSEASGPATPIQEFVVVITTSAFDATLSFYRDVIGMEVIEEWTDAGYGAVLSAGGSARVELIDLPDRVRVETGSLFIGLQVGAIGRVYERATAGAHGSCGNRQIGRGEVAALLSAIRAASR